MCEGEAVLVQLSGPVESHSRDCVTLNNLFSFNLKGVSKQEAMDRNVNQMFPKAIPAQAPLLCLETAAIVIPRDVRAGRGCRCPGQGTHRDPGQAQGPLIHQ